VILIGVGIFAIGFFSGYLTNKRLLIRESSGTIVVNRDNLREKTVYSLELDDYPEKLEFKKVVIFKVDTSEDKPHRK
jgi:hypothetical protein